MTRSAGVSTSAAAATKRGTSASSTKQGTPATETVADLCSGPGVAGRDPASSAAETPSSQADVSGSFLATQVTATGVARDVSGNEEGSRDTPDAPSASATPPTKSIAELEDVIGRASIEPPSTDGLRWERELPRSSDPFVPHGSPPASLLIFSLYIVFFFVAGFSLADISVAFSAPILRMADKRCEATSILGVCFFAQQMRSINAAGVAIGCLLGGTFADYYGRKTLLCLSDVLLVVGLSAPLMTTYFPICCASRVFFGLGLGGGLVAVSVFLVECAPNAVRGATVGFGKLVLTLGHVCAVCLRTSTPSFYSRVKPFVLAAVGSLHCIALLALAPESPRWLVRQKRPAQAVEALLRFGDNEAHATEAVLQQEQFLGFSHASEGSPSTRRCLWIPETYRILFTVQRTRFLLVLAVAVEATCVGANFLALFPTFAMTSEEKWIATSAGLVETLGVLLSVALVDFWGRLPLFWLGIVGIFVGQLMTTVGPAVGGGEYSIFGDRWPAAPGREYDDEEAFGTLFGAGCLLTRLMQNLSWSTLLPLVAAEVLPTPVRANGAGIALGLLTALEVVINMTIPFIIRDSGKVCLALAYQVSLIIAAVLLWLHLKTPEGKGYPLEVLASEASEDYVLWASDTSRGPMQQLRDARTQQGPQAPPVQPSYSQTSFALTIAATTDAEGLSMGVQNSAHGSQERDARRVC